MGPLGPTELIIILVIVLVLFGAKRLPDLGKSLGSGMREFKDAVTPGKDDDRDRDRDRGLEQGAAPAQTTQQTQREDAPAQPRA
ncbi:MAG: twin-arginine translocase TatA/TatE family subunit [Solirubrobacteraceae bacterium]|jgi:sec-independent protein translocase protein TatA